LHIDIVSYGPIHFLTIIDAFSKFLVWENLPSMASYWVASMLMRCFIELGPPGTIMADNARNLSGPEVRKTLQDFGVTLRRSSEYYPKGNSIAERVHRTLHQLARAFSLRTPTDIRREAAKLVYVYNSRPHKALGNHSPFMVLFGRDPYIIESDRYDLRELYSLWDAVRTQQAWQHRNNKIYYDRRNRDQERSGEDYGEG
ncbi:retrovirus polyprotein, putative, partial [Perkinsus marinus ATCC 50983]